MLLEPKWYELTLIPWAKNSDVDTFTRVASGIREGSLGQVHVEYLAGPSIKESEPVMCVGHSKICIDPIFDYLTMGILPADKMK